MGGEWSLDIRIRLEEFLKTLAKIADDYVHSIILLGDIFEMWMTPMAVTPPTLKEFIKKWRSDVVSWCKGVPRGSRTNPPEQKPPRHKPPDKNPLDKTPLAKNPPDKNPRQNILFRNFITFVFRMSSGKEISIWFLAVKYVRRGSIK